jgi:uroporphyrinogen-III synthase
VFLTRPAGRNESLASALRQAGAVVHEAPALAIRPLAGECPLPEPDSLCVFVSRQAVDIYFSRCPGPWPAHAWAAAVGGATARALLDHVPAARILAPGAESAPDSEALLAVIESRGLPPATAHILRAEQGRDWLAGQLRTRGWSVRLHALYARRALLWDQATSLALADASAKVLLVTSEEALQAIDASLRHHHQAWPAHLRVVTLHARLARRLQCFYAGRPDEAPGITLSAPDEAALFQAILAATRPLH